MNETLVDEYEETATDEPCLECYRGFPCGEHPTNIYADDHD